jgi:hypothetical protein
MIVLGFSTVALTNAGNAVLPRVARRRFCGKGIKKRFE